MWQTDSKMRVKIEQLVLIIARKVSGKSAIEFGSSVNKKFFIHPEFIIRVRQFVPAGLAVEEGAIGVTGTTGETVKGSNWS